MYNRNKIVLFLLFRTSNGVDQSLQNSSGIVIGIASGIVSGTWWWLLRLVVLDHLLENGNGNETATGTYVEGS